MGTKFYQKIVDGLVTHTLKFHAVCFSFYFFCFLPWKRKQKQEKSYWSASWCIFNYEPKNKTFLQKKAMLSSIKYFLDLGGRDSHGVMCCNLWITTLDCQMAEEQHKSKPICHNAHWKLSAFNCMMIRGQAGGGGRVAWKWREREEREGPIESEWMTLKALFKQIMFCFSLLFFFFFVLLEEAKRQSLTGRMEKKIKLKRL